MPFVLSFELSPTRMVQQFKVLPLAIPTRKNAAISMGTHPDADINRYPKAYPPVRITMVFFIPIFPGRIPEANPAIRLPMLISDRSVPVVL